MALLSRPLLTRKFENAEDFIPPPRSVLVTGHSPEERSKYTCDWIARFVDVSIWTIADQMQAHIRLEGSSQEIQLRSQKQLTAFWASAGRRTLLIDITGLAHHVWAPLLKAALATGRQVQVIYTEPFDYTFSKAPKEGEIFDLSERITGIAPLPGFTSLAEEDEDRVCFVPLLGFEGTRFAYLLEEVQPPGGKIVPIIGVPGFRPEYPFHTFQGNTLPLRQTVAWKNIRFAIANCPFSLLYALEDIASDYPLDLLKIAPIGTKPHALGAVLFALTTSRRVELVYDHPIRKSTRTSGKNRLLVYHVSALTFSSVS